MSLRGMRKSLEFQREVLGVELARCEPRPVAVNNSMESDTWAPPMRALRSQSVLRPQEARDLPPSAPKVLVGEREHRWYIFEPERVEYIEAHENYVKLHSGNAEYISRNTMKNLAADLESDGFVRIQRSLLINVRAIRYAQRAGRGTFAFTLTSGVTLRSGATHRQEILRQLPLAPPPASFRVK
jgi:DNA-binding LytR/AlgR family response regulator